MVIQMVDLIMIGHVIGHKHAKVGQLVILAKKVKVGEN
jgi:hypothetical protein